MTKCCVPGCPNSSKNVIGIPLFSFPSESQRRKLWMKAIKIDAPAMNENTRVCLRHFGEEDIFRFSTKTVLRARRVPHLHLNDAEVEDTLQGVEQLLAETIELNMPVTSILSKPPQNNKKRQKKQCLSRFYGARPTFAIENFYNKDKKICRYTGLPTYRILIVLFNFVLKSESGPSGVVHHTNSRTGIVRSHKLSPLNELFLTLIKLRKAPDFDMLGDMFWISESAACSVFNAWVNLLYTKLGSLNIFPTKAVLMSNAPAAFIKKYPKVIGSIDYTEFIMETPSSLVGQSQCFSHYKGTDTLKGLIMIDPNGGIIFISALHTGSISDKKIIEDSRFLELLKRKVTLGELEMGDIILADKGFDIQNLLNNIGLELNIPTFRISGMQFTPNEVEYIRKIAHERVHVERAIRRLKTFKILSHKISISMLGCINQVYTVCALLTNFRFPLTNRNLKQMT